MEKEDFFEEAFVYTIGFEGGLSCNKDDIGGETKFGISKRSYPNLDIKKLTIIEAKEIYKRDFWLRARCDSIVYKRVAIKFFDTAVNTGIFNAVIILQRAVIASGVIIKEDGKMGRQTIDAVNSISDDVLLASLKSEVAGYYRVLVAKNNSLSVFEKGWIKRAYHTI